MQNNNYFLIDSFFGLIFAIKQPAHLQCLEGAEFDLVLNYIKNVGL